MTVTAPTLLTVAISLITAGLIFGTFQANREEFKGYHNWMALTFSVGASLFYFMVLFTGYYLEWWSL